MNRILSFRKALLLLVISFSLFLLPGRVLPQKPGGPPMAWDQTRYGNHRVVLEVTGKVKRAVYVRIPWRRRDADPAGKRLILTDSAGTEIRNILPVRITREEGEVIFEPVSGPGIYYLYYMPFEVKGSRNYPKVYYLPPSEPEHSWLRKAHLTDSLRIRKQIAGMPVAKVKAMEAVNDFNAFGPMERIATQKEMSRLLSQYPEDYLLFPESRKYPIRMRHDLPYRWIEKGVDPAFRARAYRNEYFAFQIGLFAARDSLQDVEIIFEGLKDSSGTEILSPGAFTCFNKNGVSWDARSFVKKIPVPQGTVQPLWIGVDIPEDIAPGDYTGKVTIVPAGKAPQQVDLHLEVTDSVLTDRGDHESWRHSKLRWLNSRLAVDERIVKPFRAMVIRYDTVAVLGRRLVVNSSGLPAQMISYFNGSNTQITDRPVTVLADDFRMEVTFADGTVQPLDGGRNLFTRWSQGLVTWQAHPSAGSVKAEVKGKMEFDGFVQIKIFITAARKTDIRDITLVMPVDSAAAEYFMGLGYKGQRFPGAVDWRWDVKKKNQDGAWLGRVNAGFQFSLRGANYARPLNTNFYLTQPLHLPRSWGNDGKGGVRILPQGDSVVIRAYSGDRTLLPGDTLCYQVNLLLTPFKPLDLKGHWKNRYYHSFKPVDTILAAGANVINVHHATAINPYINYPFLRQDTLRNYIAAAHARGLKVKIYNTIRELSNHAPETFALRSLNHEIYSHGPGNGWAWLQEHVGEDYIAAWFVPHLRDAAIVNSGMSRWHNYYVEGLNWLAKNMQIDGIYIDDIAFDRTTMKRVRKVLDRNRPEALIDLHSANQFNPRDGYINSANLYMEHFPYLNRLWFGEYFDKDSPADFYLLEMSGIPYGLMGEMLQDGGNRWRGMLYGMTARMPWAGDPRALWKFWDETHIEDTRLIGYWDPECPVQTDHQEIKATVYQGDGYAIIALASWAGEDVTVVLDIDWEKTGVEKDKAVLEARSIKDFQEAGTYEPETVPVPAGKGLLLILRER
jgi:hypothetical protein